MCKALWSVVVLLWLVSPGWAGDPCYEAINRKAYDDAITQCTGLLSRPGLTAKNQSVCYNNRGRAWSGKGQQAQAIEDFSEALALEPSYMPAYLNRAMSYQATGQYDRANADYTMAYQLQPGSVHTINGLAWMLATCADPRYRDGKLAVELAGQAVGLTKIYQTLDTLAAAYAETGRLKEAVATQQEVVYMLPSDLSDQEKQKYFDRLGAYQAGQPWRE